MYSKHEQVFKFSNVPFLNFKRVLKRCRFPASPLEFSEIGYLLLPSRDMAERSLNRR